MTGSEPVFRNAGDWPHTGLYIDGIRQVALPPPVEFPGREHHTMHMTST